MKESWITSTGQKPRLKELKASIIFWQPIKDLINYQLEQHTIVKTSVILKKKNKGRKSVKVNNIFIKNKSLPYTQN